MAPSYTNGRRGPNVSHFLRDLNTVADKPLDEPEFTFEDDLAMFTNTHFFDYETGQNTDYQAHPIKHEMDAAPSSAVSPTSAELTSPAMTDMQNLDFMSGKSLGRLVSLPTLLSFCPRAPWRRPARPRTLLACVTVTCRARYPLSITTASCLCFFTWVGNTKLSGLPDLRRCFSHHSPETTRNPSFPRLLWAACVGSGATSHGGPAFLCLW